VYLFKKIISDKEMVASFSTAFVRSSKAKKILKIDL
jgi:hypothetical protein